MPHLLLKKVLIAEMGQVVGGVGMPQHVLHPSAFFRMPDRRLTSIHFFSQLGGQTGREGEPAEDVRLRMAPSTGRMETWRLPPVLVWLGASETRPDFRLTFFQVSLLTSWGRMPAYSIRAQAGRHAPWNNCSAVWRSRFASYRERALMRFP